MGAECKRREARLGGCSLSAGLMMPTKSQRGAKQARPKQLYVSLTRHGSAYTQAPRDWRYGRKEGRGCFLSLHTVHGLIDGGEIEERAGRRHTRRLDQEDGVPRSHLSCKWVCMCDVWRV